jgi:hypothetical protein
MTDVEQGKLADDRSKIQEFDARSEKAEAKI